MGIRVKTKFVAITWILMLVLSDYVEQYVALKTQLKAEEVELLVTKEEDKATEGNIPSSSTEKMQSVKDDETLAKLRADCISGHDYLVLSLL